MDIRQGNLYFGEEGRLARPLLRKGEKIMPSEEGFVTLSEPTIPELLLACEMCDSTCHCDCVSYEFFDF